MATNHQFEKRKREMEKKAKKEEKRLRKIERANNPQSDETSTEEPTAEEPE